MTQNSHSLQKQVARYCASYLPISLITFIFHGCDIELLYENTFYGWLLIFKCSESWTRWSGICILNQERVLPYTTITFVLQLLLIGTISM